MKEVWMLLSVREFKDMGKERFSCFKGVES